MEQGKELAGTGQKQGRKGPAVSVPGCKVGSEKTKGGGKKI